uniref:C4orf27 homolog n=1 Tax=Caligus rogercresseyi TaxID=217165 RepID=C1BP37_CALRO|nr:C4orf27 homolog [Caligus rogercresseyi]
MSQDSKDLREDCKYGKTCYQRNPAHHARFKHPPKEEEPVSQPPTKKAKITQNEANDSLLGVKRFFPPEFYSFYDWVKSLKPEDPLTALQETSGLRLAGDFYNLEDEMKWRFYYDPPEFLSLLIQVDSSGKTQDDHEHMGYFWDDPKEAPAFVGHLANNSSKIRKHGVNLFAALHQWNKDELKKADPFRKTKILKLNDSLTSFATAQGLSLELKPESLKTRDKRRVVASPFHGGGLVVPYDKKTSLGYRELPESTTSLKKMFKKAADSQRDEDESAMDAIQELVTFVQFANDEGDPGMGLELGLNLFSFENSVDAFHPTIKHLLCVAYELLGRDHLSRVAQRHLSLRKKGEFLPKAGK